MNLPPTFGPSMRFALLLIVVIFSISAVACSTSPERDAAIDTDEVHHGDEVVFEDSDIIPVADSPVRGADDAWVTVVVFADFQCPFCARLAATLDAVMDSLGEDTMRLVFKHHPLEAHEGAQVAALAAEAAREQDGFWKMHDALFDDFARLSGDEPKRAALQIAADVGLDDEQLAEDMTRDEVARRVDADRALADDLELESVPAVFINGGFIPGAQPLETYYRTILDVRNILEQSVARGEVERGEVYRSSVETLYSETRPEESRAGRRASPVAEVAVDGDEPQTAQIDEAVVQIALFLSLSDAPSLELQRQIDRFMDADDEVRIVYFHLPHAQDEATRLAHRALEGADSAREVRELLRWLSDEDNDWRTEASLLEEYVADQQIAVVSGEEFDSLLESHVEMAQSLEIQGTPTTFVNGIRVLGAPEPPKLEALIEEQIALALRVREIQGLEGSALYEEMVEGNRQRLGGGR